MALSSGGGGSQRAGLVRLGPGSSLPRRGDGGGLLGPVRLLRLRRGQAANRLRLLPAGEPRAGARGGHGHGPGAGLARGARDVVLEHRAARQPALREVAGVLAGADRCDAVHRDRAGRRGLGQGADRLLLHRAGALAADQCAVARDDAPPARGLLSDGAARHPDADAAERRRGAPCQGAGRAREDVAAAGRGRRPPGRGFREPARRVRAAAGFDRLYFGYAGEHGAPHGEADQPLLHHDAVPLRLPGLRRDDLRRRAGRFRSGAGAHRRAQHGGPALPRDADAVARRPEGGAATGRLHPALADHAARFPQGRAARAHGRAHRPGRPHL